MRPVEDRQASLDGIKIYKDVEYIKITPVGGGLVVDKEITEELLNHYRFSPDPGMQHRYKAYKDWKEGKEAPINGTPLTMWPVATPAQIKQCHAVKIRSVQELAELPDSALKQLGLDGRLIRDKARDWIKSGESQGKIVEEIASIKVMVEDLKKENERLMAQNENLVAQLENRTTAPKIKLKSA